MSAVAKSTAARSKVEKILALADVRIDGDRPWDMIVHNEDFYDRVMGHGTMGLGESYMEGWWDAEALDQFFDKVLGAQLDKRVRTAEIVLTAVKSRLFNQQSRTRSKRVAEQHYDLGNEFYQHMLDPRMQYTCGYWKDADNLADAQTAKLDLVCRKLGLQPGERVLELGCGWGGFAHYAAKNYGCHVTAYNISKEQVAYAREINRDLPVDIRHADYREAEGEYDKVASIGLMEHVGYKNYRTFIETAHRCLKDDGLFLLHTIGSSTTKTCTDPWINTYIFPGGMLPSAHQISGAYEGCFVMEDWHNFGPDYDKTLMAWFRNFDANWAKFRDQYGDTFYRMWKYYLLSCAGSFRARQIQLWQVVLSKGGVRGGYTAVR